MVVVRQVIRISRSVIQTPLAGHPGDQDHLDGGLGSNRAALLNESAAGLSASSSSGAWLERSLIM